jgi:hypothetical protein
MAEHLSELMARIAAERAAMDPEARKELERRERQAQRESWVRAMAPCEHGIADFEDCEECRRG